MLVLKVLVGVLNLAAAVVAQTGPQASKIPPCVVCRPLLLLGKSYALFVLIINHLRRYLVTRKLSQLQHAIPLIYPVTANKKTTY